MKHLTMMMASVHRWPYRDPTGEVRVRMQWGVFLLAWDSTGSMAECSGFEPDPWLAATRAVQRAIKHLRRGERVKA